MYSYFQKSIPKPKQSGNRTRAERTRTPKPDHELGEERLDRLDRAREERMAHLRMEQARLKEIEREQEARLKALEDIRKRMENDLKRRQDVALMCSNLENAEGAHPQQHQ